MAPNATPISEEALQDALRELSGWSIEDGMLHKTFKFKNFSEAMGWMVSVALEAEKLDHHPDWSNTWNKVDVYLQTHSIGALSELDVTLARKMEKLVR